MNVLILGVDHEIQKVDAWRSEEMKTAYRDLLREIVGHYEVQFIGGEVGPDDETVGAQLTAALNLPFPWRNIDMPETARKAACIFQEQRDRVPEPRLGTVQTHLAADGFYFDLGNGSHEYCPRVPSDSVREDYMFARALEGAGEACSMLILVGNLHVEELAARFVAHGDATTQDAVYRYPWYNPYW